MKSVDRLRLAYIDLRRWCGRRGCDGYEQGSCRIKRSARKNATCTKTRHTIPQRYKRASTIDPAGFGSDASANVNGWCPHEALCNRSYSILNWLIDCQNLASALDKLTSRCRMLDRGASLRPWVQVFAEETGGVQRHAPGLVAQIINFTDHVERTIGPPPAPATIIDVTRPRRMEP